MIFQTLRVIFITALVALTFGPLAYWLTLRLRLLDIPGSEPHKRHPKPTPLAGGTAIILAILITGLLEKIIHRPLVWPILIPAIIVFLFGLWDDLRGLPPRIKVAGQILAAIVLIRLGIYVRLFPWQWLNLVITYLWIVGITNAYNFVDTMDGLATGLAGLTAAFFMLVTLDSGQSELALLSAMLVGACVGTFFYTSTPAKFFLGDSGAQALGFILAALAIAYNPPGFMREQSWYVPILLTGVPIFDMTLVVVSRLRRGLPVYQAGTDHTYHRLVKLGLDSNRAVLTMQFAAMMLGCLAFIALSLPPMWANAIFTACTLIGLLSVIFLEKIWP